MLAARAPGGVSAHPLTAFTVLALGITWAAWMPQAAASRGLLPEAPWVYDVLYVVGGTGPLVAAWLVLRAQHGPGVEGRLFAPLARWRVHPGWYLLALAGPMLLTLGALTVTGRWGSAMGGLEVTWAWAWVLLIRLVAAVPEELAWRGFALPRLQARYNGLVAAVIIGVVWALWHLPLLLNRDNPMSTYPIASFLLSVVATSVVYTWIYNSTGGSVLILTLLHGVGNAAGDVFFGGDAALWKAFHTVNTVAMTALAVALVAIFGTGLSSRTPQAQLPEEARRP